MPIDSRTQRLSTWPLIVVAVLAFGLGGAATVAMLKHDVDLPSMGTAAVATISSDTQSTLASSFPPPLPRTISSGDLATASTLEPGAPDRHAQEFSNYESLFRAESRVDPSWAQPAERSLVEAATDESLVAYGVPSEFDARCARRLCRVKMAFDDATQANDWSELYVLGMSDAVTLVRSMTIPRQDGRTELILYGARKGSENLLGESVVPTRH